MKTSPYQIIRRIATGGMAEVLLAIQRGLGGFEKLVVIKRILPHLCQDGQFVQMFLNEARLAASLNHPNIVEIFDVHRRGETFAIAMEYLSGEDLLFVLNTITRRNKEIPIPIVCRIAADVASGLAAAHENRGADGEPAEVVHRDVTPGNIIITYDGVIKLLDFGVAKANVHNIYTRPGILKGKFAYHSPEQILHKDLDGRSDLFALGIVLWEMLTSSKLFKGPSEAAVLKAVMEKKIVPPSTINPKVPKVLNELVMQVLERDLGQRIQSATQLCDLLEGVAKPLGGNLTRQDVAQWMQATFAKRFANRRKIEREVMLEARDSAQEPPTTPVKLMSLFDSGPGSDTTPLTPVSSGEASSPPWRQRMGLVVALTIAGTLILVVLVGLAFWAGRRFQQSGSEAAVARNTPGNSSQTDPSPGGGATNEPHVEPLGVERIDQGAGLATDLSVLSAVPHDMGADQARPPDPAAAEPRRSARAPKPRTRPSARRLGFPRRGPAAAVVRPHKPATEPSPAEPAPPRGTPAADAPAPRTAPADAATRTAATQPDSEAPPKPSPTPPAGAVSGDPQPAPHPPTKKALPAPTPTTGTLYVTSDAKGYVFIDGKNTGKTTPARLRLRVGDHTVVVLLKGTNTQIRQQVVIKPGKVIRLRLRGTP